MNGYNHLNGDHPSQGQPSTSSNEIIIPPGPTNQPRVLLRSLNGTDAVFQLSGVETAYANSLRRVMMADVPTIGEYSPAWCVSVCICAIRSKDIYRNSNITRGVVIGACHYTSHIFIPSKGSRVIPPEKSPDSSWIWFYALSSPWGHGETCTGCNGLWRGTECVVQYCTTTHLKCSHVRCTSPSYFHFPP